MGEENLSAVLLKAKAGDMNAQFQLAKMYEDGVGVEQNIHKAIRWYQKASNQGHTDAQFNLGLIYYSGQGAAPNIQKAKSLFIVNGLEKIPKNGRRNSPPLGLPKRPQQWPFKIPRLMATGFPHPSG